MSPLMSCVPLVVAAAFLVNGVAAAKLHVLSSQMNPQVLCTLVVLCHAVASVA